MIRMLLEFLDPVLHPLDRTRALCLVLLVSLVTALLYGGAQPAIVEVIPSPPLDKLTHMIAFGGFAALAWVVMGARLLLGPILVAGLISLLDEGLQYYTPGRSADIRDLAADLAGAVVAVLVLRSLRVQSKRLALAGSR